ncbi:MAG TPA: GNAT family N-acetyltransferase [Solirubrobacteraceae bacterium]|nr:GNAT family N-acetyltransferase [Solirubrobacteraceae bacterium]
MSGDFTPLEFGREPAAVNGSAPVAPGAEEQVEESDWQVRGASHRDIPAVVAGIAELLVELGGKPAPSAALEATARALIDDGDAGVLLVAECEDQIVGVLGVSWQIAIRIPGRYGLIQELWVHPSWRGRTIGGDLLVALFKLARHRQVTRLEVGLPSERFPHLAATEAFYLNNGFTTIGTRMRRLLE